jgi:hypothetical protein
LWLVILLTIAVSYLIEAWFMLLWLSYIVVHYCLRFNRGVVHIVVAGYIVEHYCVMFNRGVIHIVLAVILFSITV